jgi:hypothetical protein
VAARTGQGRKLLRGQGEGDQQGREVRGLTHYLAHLHPLTGFHRARRDQPAGRRPYLGAGQSLIQNPAFDLGSAQGMGVVTEGLLEGVELGGRGILLPGELLIMFHLPASGGDLARQALLLDQNLIALPANEGVIDAGEGPVRRNCLADVDADVLHAPGNFGNQAHRCQGPREAGEVHRAHRRQGGDKLGVRSIGRVPGRLRPADQGGQQGRKQ